MTISRPKSLSLVVLLTLWGLTGTGRSQVVRTNVGTPAPTAPMPGVTMVPQTGLGNQISPAFQGGVSFSVLPGQSTLKPSISPQPVTRSAVTELSLPKTAVPSLSPSVKTAPDSRSYASPAVGAQFSGRSAAPSVRRTRALGSRTQAPAESAPKTGIIGSVKKLASGLTSGKVRGISDAGRIRSYYDGGSAAGRSIRDTLGSADAGDAQTLASGFAAGMSAQMLQEHELTGTPTRKLFEQPGRDFRGIPGEISFEALRDGSDIQSFRPRAVFITDVFKKPASARTVRQIQQLIDGGVHVVFLTWRPHKGKDSADSVLLSKLQMKPGNPMFVVSENGARIARVLDSERSVEVRGGFTDSEVKKLREIKARVEKAMGLRIELSEGLSHDRLSYRLGLKQKLSPAKLAQMRSEVLKRFNSALRSADLPYRMESHPDDPRSIIVYSMPLHFSLPRVLQVLDERFRREGLAARHDELMLVADGRSQDRIIEAFPESSEVQDIDSEAGLNGVLGAVIGESSLSPLKIDLGNLRQYEEFWKPVGRRLARNKPAEPAAKKGRGRQDPGFALYTYIVFRELLSTFYTTAFHGGHFTLKKLEARLDEVWNDPIGSNLWLGKDLARSTKTKTWKNLSPGYLHSAHQYLRNFWFREWGDFSAAQNDLMENLAGMDTWRDSKVPVRLRSAMTGRLYEVNIAPARVMKMDTADGRMLTATAYRFGQDKPGPGDEMLAKMLAIATLKGYGRKGMDLQWHHGTPMGPAISRIQVQLEYRKSHFSWSFTPDELFQIQQDGTIRQGPLAEKVVSVIEREVADHAYARSLRFGGDVYTKTADPEENTTLLAVKKFFGRFFKSDKKQVGKPHKSEAEKAVPKKRTQRQAQRAMVTALAPSLQDGSVDAEGGDLSTTEPRVVFLLDVFDKPASETTVSYVQKLIDSGVHVVFLTWRAQKGPGSADEVLLSRIKYGRANPVIVISHNGGRIALHSRAKNPKPILEDKGAFTAEDVKTFQGINKKLIETFGLEKGQLKEEGLPSIKSAFSYIIRFPKSMSAEERKTALKLYNAELSDAGLPYRMGRHPEDASAIMMHAIPLRFTLNQAFSKAEGGQTRIETALQKMFRGEDIWEHPEMWLVLTDSQRQPKFSRSFPKDTEVHVVKGDGSVNAALGAVLRERRLDTVTIKLGKLRQYVEYWESLKKPSNSGGAGGKSMAAQERMYDQAFAKFTGSVFYRLMPWFFEQIWRGQHKLTTLSNLESKLYQMWTDPFKYGVFISKHEAEMMKSPMWRKKSKEFYRYAKAFLRNFWAQEFSDYSSAADDIMKNLVSLSTDRKSLITLKLKSQSTGKLYKVFTRVPILMKHDTADGRVLSVLATRTGKETPDDGDKFLAKIMAMATLVAYGKKGADRRWHHGWHLGRRIALIHVRLQYRTAARDLFFDPDELLQLQDNGKISQGTVVQEIISAIERMEADPEYQKFYEEREQAAKEEDAKPEKKKKAAPRADKKGGSK